MGSGDDEEFDGEMKMTMKSDGEHKKGPKKEKDLLEEKPKKKEKKDKKEKELLEEKPKKKEKKEKKEKELLEKPKKHHKKGSDSGDDEEFDGEMKMKSDGEHKKGPKKEKDLLEEKPKK